MEFGIAAILLGFLGSFHCIGMCGPIALALPVHHYSSIKKYSGIFLYNLGRSITYALLGVIFGLLGQSFYLGGFQQILSITLGSLILLFIIFSYTPINYKINLNSLNRLINTLKNNLGKLFNKKGLQFLFMIGLLNGLLPCGFVYIAVAGAAATGNYINGGIFMFLFGLATIPVMFTLSIFGQLINLRYRNLIHKSVPVLVSVMAILLIIRGLNLGIPLLSPEYKKEIVTENSIPKKHVTIKCCVPPKNKTQ